MSVLKLIFFGLIGLAMLQIAFYYPRMPDVVASHFDGLGTPNGWSGRLGFFGLYAAILLLLTGVFIYLPGWSEKRTSFGMRIPNREFWLEPEQIESTRLFFRRQMLIIGVAHLGLAIFTMQLAIVANFDQTPRLHHSIAWALGIYFLFLSGWLIHFFLHFRKV